jgi:hypothetical protein
MKKLTRVLANWSIHLHVVEFLTLLMNVLVVVVAVGEVPKKIKF